MAEEIPDMKTRLHMVRSFACAACLLLAGHYASAYARSDDNSYYFAETGHTVSGKFLDYWKQHGELMQFGYPLSDEIQERSESGGNLTVQYFERAEFELHPENPSPLDVKLSPLGTRAYMERYGCTGGLDQRTSDDKPYTFESTGKTLGGRFRTYWEQHDGLYQIGYPISNEFEEFSPLDGKLYTVQYFENSELEYHPENADTPYEVLISHLGASKYEELQRDGLKPITVWEDNTHSCPTCERDISGEDPETGEVFPIATGPADQVDPVAYGRKVAWVEVDQNGYSLMLKYLDSGQVTVVPYEADAVGALRLSDQYLTWVKPNWQPRRGVPQEPDELFAYDLRTGQVNRVTTISNPFGWSDQVVALSGHWIVWSEETGTKAQDLNSGESWDISPDFTTELDATKNLVAWSTNNGSFAYDLIRHIRASVPPCK